MSDPMEDEELLAVVQMALFAGLADCAPFDAISEAAVRAILNAGYRIVKPDETYAKFEATAIGRNGGSFIGIDAHYDRKAAVQEMAEKISAHQDETGERVDAVTDFVAVEVPIDAFLAELESMKEEGE